MEEIKDLVGIIRSTKGVENLDKFLGVEEAKVVSTLLDKLELLFHQGGWVNVKDSLPKELETVWISNGKGWTTLGCLAYDDGWYWAETNGVIYEGDGEIVSEAEIDDLDVQFWHPVPKPIKK